MKKNIVPNAHPLATLLRRLNKFCSKILVYGRMIKFEHTIFALPFALASLLLAHRENPVEPRLVFWIIMAMIWARSAAMGFNRLVDARWDGKNPRTAGREIPAGNISRRDSALFVLICSLLFVLSAASISRICFWFSFPVLFLLCVYSYTKRFTWLSHLFLGFVQALVPLGVWLAVTGGFSLKIAAMSLTLGTYIAGFDLLYACQDVEFDRREGLYSMPANLGIERSIAISAFLHIITFISLASLYWIFDLSPFYFFFAAVIGILLIVEHRLVKPNDLSKINIAFFHVNSIISVLLFAALMTEELVRRIHLP
ncbi:MAG: UbiA-like polyprenyltransferase [Syntrophales bacterium]|nr:UbiA-like polyprenyltransferase [Syntrophales bacterium]